MGYGMSHGAADTVSMTVGGVLGVSQTFLLRKYVDDPMATAYVTAKSKGQSPTPPFLIKQMKGFGSPSAIFGIAGGVVGITLGAEGKMRGRIIKDESVADGLLAYGVSAGTSGVYSGVFPTSSWAAAVASDPSNPVGFSGGVQRRNVAVQSGGNNSEPVSGITPY